MRKFLYIFSLILTVNFSFASTVDSLTQIINSQSGADKFNSFISLIDYQLSQEDWNAANESIQKLATDKCVSTKSEEAEVMLWEGKLFEKRFDTENALVKYFSSLEIAQDAGDKIRIAKSKLAIGKVQAQENETDQAIQYLQSAFEIATELNDPMMLAESNKELGNLFLQKKVLGSAQQHLSQAIQIYSGNGNLKEAAQLASDFGVSLRDMGDYEQSMVYQRMAMDLNRGTNDPKSLGNNFLEITQTLIETDEYEEALINAQQGLGVFKSIKDAAGQAAGSLFLAEIFSKMGQKDKSLTHLQTAENQTINLPSSSKKAAALNKISGLWAAAGNYEKSYKLQSAFVAEKDAVASAEKSKTMAELSTRFESKFKAKEQKQQIDLLETEKKAQSKIKWMWAGLFLLAFGIAASLYNMYKNKKEDNQLLHDKNLEIEEKNSSLDMVNNRLLEEISEREYLEKSSFERDRFLATMTHRMGTPLNSIVGLSHLLLDDNPTPEHRDKLKTLQFAANSLVVFINDVLDFSKIEAGKLKTDATNFQAKKLFNDLREQAQMEADDKGINVVFDYDKNIPKVLSGDPARLNQILTNMLSTSMKMTSEGSVDVSFGIDEETDDNLLLKVEISDTGKALDAEVVAKIFQSPDEYYLLGKKNGIAFAMTMARRLVELQKGKFEIFTNEEHGNMFRFFIPLNKVNTEGHQPETLNQRLAGNRILVVEDNIINQMVVTNMLRNLKMEVVTANHGLEALDRMKDYNFDLILMDIQMPEMDGYRATAAIRKMADPIKRDVPIIALTASAFLTHEDKAKLFGMNEHVGKPFSPDELLEKIDKLLRVAKRKEK